MNLDVSGLTIVERLTADAASDSMLVDTRQGRFVMKVARDTAATSLLEFAQRLARVSHPSLTAVRGAGRLDDGRPYVIVEPPKGPTLSGASLPHESAVQAGIELAKGLEALHEAGLAAGPLTARDVFLSHPASLDVSLAGLAAPTSAAEDVERVVQHLVAHAERPESLRDSLAGVSTAQQLASRLESIHTHARTVSGSGASDVEVLEPDLSGNQLGSWQLERILGEGAMGRVYLARHNRIGRLAAVKVLKSEHATSAELVQRFIQEAQAVNAIKNEHIVEVYDFGELTKPDGGRLVYCVMELLEGQALADALAKGPMPVKRAASISRQLALALGEAHRVGVIHRDVKPENVFLQRRPGDDDFVKVLDFGVAKLLKPIGDLPQSGTLAGVVVGTPEYMAPEQALGVAVDVRSDLYAVGLILYELLSGTQPFQADTFGKLVVAITQNPPPPLPNRSRLDEPIPKRLANLVYKCLAKDAEARFQSGDELAKALEPFALGLPIVESAEPADELEPVESLVVKRSKWPWVAFALVGALVAVAVGWQTTANTAPVVPTEPSPPQVETAVVVDAPKTPTPPAEAATISLEISTTPAGAHVMRADGTELGVTPLSLTQPRGELTTLRFELDGYEPETREVNLSRSLAMTLELKARKVAAEKKKNAPAAKKKVKANNDGTVDPFEE